MVLIFYYTLDPSWGLKPFPTVMSIFFSLPENPDCVIIEVGKLTWK